MSQLPTVSETPEPVAVAVVRNKIRVEVRVNIRLEAIVRTVEIVELIVVVLRANNNNRGTLGNNYHIRALVAILRFCGAAAEGNRRTRNQTHHHRLHHHNLSRKEVPLERIELSSQD